MTIIATGQSFSIEFDAVVYNAQVAEVMLTSTQTINRATVLNGSVTWRSPESYQLRIRGYQDWGAVGSFCDAMWDAAATGDVIPFELVDGTVTWTGNVAPVFPTAGGAADSALEFDLTLEVDGAVTKA
jgi:hypothetical protein